MGTVSSKDTRCISFNNTCAVSPALTVHKSIEDENVLDIDTITAVTEQNEELLFSETNKSNNNKPPDVRREYLKEELELDYWVNRIETLKQEHRMINKIIETEYEKTLENNNTVLKKTYDGNEVQSKIKPCFDWRFKIMQCYEDNAHQPLVCSPIVQAFTDCVKSCSLPE